MKSQSLQVPYNDRVTDKNSILTNIWMNFFRHLKDIVDMLGYEKSFNLLNNQLTPQKISGLRFNKKQIVNFCEYVIQRITDNDEAIESGIFKVVYRAKSDDFVYIPDPNAGPNSSGATLSINAASGEMSYISSANANVQKTFKLTVRQAYLTGGNTL